MKISLLLVAGMAALCTQCARSPAVAPAPSFDEASIALMRELAPQVVGNWTMAAVHVQFKPGVSYPGSHYFPLDTVMRQFAQLAITPAQVGRHAPADPRYPEFDGQLTYQGKTYPVYFSLRAAADYLVNKQGPPAIFLLEYHFPAGSHPTEPEEQFLQFLGLVGDNFSLELAAGQPAMVWRGLSRSVARIDLQR